jgi:uncharacterized membrane protein YheB (UPF0754 family)
MSGLGGILADAREHWLLYASLPLLAALIGYVTKLVAVEMMFRPIEFVGRPPVLGWQGIIPRNAGRMAAIACDTLTEKLLNARDLMERLDPHRMVDELEEPLTRTLQEITEEAASVIEPELWPKLPARAKAEVVARAPRDAPRVVAEIMDEITRDVEGVFDLKEMVVTSLMRDKKTLNKMFRKAGHREFRFIVRFGFPSGLVIGLVQAVAWALLKEPLIMPAFGLITGWATDFTALKLVFVPKEPKRVLGLFTWQGLFFKHRREFTDLYAELVAHQVIKPRNMIEALLQGPTSDRLFAIVHRRLHDEIEAQVGGARPLVVLAVGGPGYQRLKNLVTERVLSQLPETVGELEDYAADALDVRNTVVEKMRELSLDQFEQLLRPAFRQDEWKLIAVGALLGFGVGELQTLLVEHFGH